jgi:two-component system, chemotaxis family, protein-glutamate methylesterase/glutaminase
LANGRRNLVVIGASLGGVQALCRLLGELPAELDATLFVAQHTGRDSQLQKVLQAVTSLAVQTARHGESFELGTVYVAPPERHMLIEGKRIQVIRGPRENGARPAIDPLFRSAAAHHGPRVVGVVLTGLRDDGAAGLDAIRRSGGVTIVQDPLDAAFPDMPRNALAAAPADHVLPIERMGELIVRLSKQIAPAGEPPVDVVREARITARYAGSEEAVQALGRMTHLDCPECGGPLWELGEVGHGRFRCRIGHSFTPVALAAQQNEAVERSLLVAMRTLEERGRLLDRLHREAIERGRNDEAGRFGEDRDETLSHADVLRELLLSLR